MTHPPEDWHAIVARYARPVRWKSLWQLARSLAAEAPPTRGPLLPAGGAEARLKLIV